MTIKIALKIEYEGTKYHGFQYQPGVSTVQGEIENSHTVAVGSDRVEASKNSMPSLYG